MRAPRPNAPWVSEPPAQVDARSADRRRAFGMLGISRDADRDAIEAAYLAAVERYNPASLRHLGADFVALAARRLGDFTAAYELACAAPSPRATSAPSEGMRNSVAM